jgi:Ser/Thr protein kinase RdoA (MazF antagonist)
VFAIANSASPTIQPVARGAVGRVWRLDTGSGSYAVKEFFWGADEDLARPEAAFRDAAAEAGVRSPLNIQTRVGTYLSKLPEELGGSQVRVYSWVRGEPVSEDEPRVAAEVGEMLGRLHALRAPTTESPDPWYEIVPTDERWDSLARSASNATMPWADDLRQSLPAIAALSRLVIPAGPADLIICHQDLQASNLLRDADGLILLDWDNVGSGSAARELASTLWTWECREGVIDRSGVTDMLAAYRAAGGHATIDSPEALGMAVATHLNFTFVQAELALDATAGEDHRERAHAWTVRGLATLPTAAALGELIDAVRSAG